MNLIGQTEKLTFYISWRRQNTYGKSSLWILMGGKINSNLAQIFVGFLLKYLLKWTELNIDSHSSAFEVLCELFISDQSCCCCYCYYYCSVLNLALQKLLMYDWVDLEPWTTTLQLLLYETNLYRIIPNSWQIHHRDRKLIKNLWIKSSLILLHFTIEIQC